LEVDLTKNGFLNVNLNEELEESVFNEFVLNEVSVDRYD
jgi:hypothetical protein